MKQRIRESQLVFSVNKRVKKWSGKWDPESVNFSYHQRLIHANKNIKTEYHSHISLVHKLPPAKLSSVTFPLPCVSFKYPFHLDAGAL